MEFYKGYVLTNGKKEPQEALKSGTYHTYEQIKSARNYAGVLADNVILIDIDDAEQAELLMNIIEERNINCQVLQTTRGKHFLFENAGVTTCGTKVKLACGLTADIKVGGKNTVEVLKIDGKERWTEWEVNDEPCRLPKWLTPVRSNTDFLGMKDGDGRDSALYAYILTLMGSGFARDEVRETIRIINNYIFSDKMSDEDIDRITRDDAFPTEVWYKGRTFMHNVFADYLRATCHIIRINNQLYAYEDGVYVPGMKQIEAAIVKHLPALKSSGRVEVLKYLDIVCEDRQPAPENYIAFKNGVLDLATGDLLAFSPDLIVTNRIPWNYNPDAYSELVDRTLDKISCGDKEIRAVMEEAMGYTFYRRNELSKSFFCIGSGANGKSTWLDMVNSMVGASNSSALSLTELDERFSVVAMLGKLVNVGDDISDEFWDSRSTAFFRKLVSGNAVKAEHKGQDPFFFKPYVKFFFSANALPRVRSKGFDAIKRRLVIIPFNAKFSESDPDYRPHIASELREPEAMEYAVQLAIAGLERVLRRNKFTECAAVEAEIETYEIENNPVLSFLADNSVEDMINEPVTAVYRNYKRYCVENGFTELNLYSFSRELYKNTELTSVRRKIDGVKISFVVRKTND